MSTTSPVVNWKYLMNCAHRLDKATVYDLSADDPYHLPIPPASLFYRFEYDHIAKRFVVRGLDAAVEIPWHANKTCRRSSHSCHRSAVLHSTIHPTWFNDSARHRVGPGSMCGAQMSPIRAFIWFQTHFQATPSGESDL